MIVWDSFGMLGAFCQGESELCLFSLSLMFPLGKKVTFASWQVPVKGGVYPKKKEGRFFSFSFKFWVGGGYWDIGYQDSGFFFLWIVGSEGGNGA